MNKMSITDVDVKGKRVLTRLDLNVPMDENLSITDDTRVRASLPTVKYIIENGGKAILMSHLGRPKGQVNDKYRLGAVAKRLSELLGQNVVYVTDCIGPDAEAAVAGLKDGDVCLLENVRFYAEEEKNNPEFAAKLAKLGDIYCNDAFGSAHRAHASTEGVTKYLSPSVAGFLMQKELDFLGKALANPERPFIAIIGGAKVSSKISVIKNLLPKVDKLLLGGAMTYTFYKAKGLEIGKSLLEPDYVPLAAELLAEAGDKLVIPVDNMVADAFSADANTQLVERDSFPSDYEGVDIGPQTMENFKEIIASAKTIVWNGPLGVFEIDKFATGTTTIAKAVGASSAVTIIGGGDSIAALEKAGCIDKMSHVSTGGGASLEFLEGKVLPGVAALTDK